MQIGKEIKEGAYDRYFEAKTDYENLEEQKKTMLAVYEMKYSVEGKTQSEISRSALADKEYGDWISGLNEARKAMNQAFAKVKALEARLSVYQSLNKHFTNSTYET